MITTGFTIPKVVLKRLATAVAAIHRETTTMTIADWRKAYRERKGPTVGCFVYVNFTKTGAVNSFQARRIDKSSEKFRLHGFETDVPLLGSADYAARKLAVDCGEFFLRREVEQRRNAGYRELAALTDEELIGAVDELKPLERTLSKELSDCGSLSEKLRQHVLEDEIEIRKAESNHQRLLAVAKNANHISACQQQVMAEKVAAKKWRLAKKARHSSYIRVHYEFENRSNDDQTVIAYRDAMGWPL